MASEQYARAALGRMPSQLMRCTGSMDLLVVDDGGDSGRIYRWDHWTGARTVAFEGTLDALLGEWSRRVSAGGWFVPTERHLLIANWPAGLRAKAGEETGSEASKW